MPSKERGVGREVEGGGIFREDQLIACTGGKLRVVVFSKRIS